MARLDASTAAALCSAQIAHSTSIIVAQSKCHSSPPVKRGVAQKWRQGRKDMHSKNCISALAILLFATFPVFAANETSGKTKVTRIENWVAEDGLFIKTEQPQLTNPANCLITDKYVLAATATNVSRSILLTAYAAKLSLSMVIYGGGCIGDRPMVVAVTLSE